MAFALSENPNHKAGFVNIIGKPNVGKSTLMNKLVGENVSIITSKAQTTRHRILGMMNGEDFQIVYSDTPGILKPQYELHKSMMQFVRLSVEDADVLLLMVEIFEKVDREMLDPILRKTDGKIILLLNKVDNSDRQHAARCIIASVKGDFPGIQGFIVANMLEGNITKVDE